MASETPPLTFTIWWLQIGTVAHCANCNTLFHAKCVRGSKHGKAAAGSGSKWWVDQQEANNIFVCPQVGVLGVLS